MGGADFLRLWYVGLVSFLIRWMETLAVAVFVLQKTGSPFLVAMMTMLRILPMGLFGSVMGAWAERWERRSCLLLLTGVMLATDAALCLSAARGGLTIWAVAIGSFVNGIGWAGDNPIRRVAIGEVTGTERMGTAMSLDVAANNGTRILGPVIGGALLAFSGITAVFAFATVLYASAILTLLSVAYRNQAITRAPGSVLAHIAEGIRCARTDRRLFATLLVTVIYNVFAWPFTSMVPVVAQQHLALGTISTGALASMDGVGALLGASAMAFGGARRGSGLLYLRRHGPVLRDDRRVCAVAICDARRRGPAAGGHRQRLLLDTAGNAGLSLCAAGDEEPDAGTGVHLHRHRADRVRAPRLARDGDRRAMGHGDNRNRGSGCDGADISDVAGAGQGGRVRGSPT